MASNDDNDTGMGLGSGVGVAATAAAGTAGAALIDGAIATRKAGVAKLETKANDAAKALHEAWGAEKIKELKLSADEQRLFDKHIKPLLEAKHEGLESLVHTADNPLKHSHVSSVLSVAKNGASAEEQNFFDSLLGKLKPIEHLEKTGQNAGWKYISTKALSEGWKELTWLEIIEGSIARSPKKFAFVYAPLIALGSAMGVSYLTSGERAEMGCNGQGPAR